MGLGEGRERSSCTMMKYDVAQDVDCSASVEKSGCHCTTPMAKPAPPESWRGESGESKARDAAAA